MSLLQAVLLAAAWLGTYLIHSTVLLGGAWVWTRGERLPLRWRDRIWKLALVGGLATASLQTGLGFEPFGGRVWLSGADEVARLEVEDASPSAEEASARTVPAERPLAVKPKESFSSRRGRLAAPGKTAPGETTHEDTAHTAATHGRRAPARRRTEPTKGAPFEATVPIARDEDASFPAGTLAARPAPPSAGPEALPEDAGTDGPLGARLQSRPWMGVLWILWLVGAVAGVFAFARALARLRAHLAGRTSLESGPLRERLDALIERSGVRGRVRLSVSTRLHTPLTHGFLRREICVPARALTDLSPAQQEAMLGHELGHAIRRDPAWMGLCWMLERVLLVQPLNRVARARLSECAEMLCDDWAVHLTGRRLPLASCLAEVAGWIVAGRPALPAPAMASSAAPLTQRVERLLDDPPREVSHRERWWLALGLAGLGLVAGAAPGFAAVRDRAPLPREAEWADATDLDATDLDAPPFDVPPATSLDALPTPAPARPAEARSEAATAALQLVDEIDAELQLTLAELRDLKRLAADRGASPDFERRLAAAEDAARRLLSQRETLRTLLPRVLESL